MWIIGHFCLSGYNKEQGHVDYIERSFCFTYGKELQNNEKKNSSNESEADFDSTQELAEDVPRCRQLVDADRCTTQSLALLVIEKSILKKIHIHIILAAVAIISKWKRIDGNGFLVPNF